MDTHATHSDNDSACSLGSHPAARCSASPLDDSATAAIAASSQNDDDAQQSTSSCAKAAASGAASDANQTAEDDGDHYMDEHDCTEMDTIMTSPEQDDNHEDDDKDDDSDSVEECCSLVDLLSADRSSTSSSMDVDSAGSHGAQRRKWIHAIQNESFQPKPTAFSPLGSFEEDPLLGQQRQCRDKLEALEHVRNRVQFFPLVAAPSRSARSSSPASTKTKPSMAIHTRMILSKLEDDSGRVHPTFDELEDFESIGIEALSGLESLFFTFLTHNELIRVSEVCRSWKSMARHNLIWEPMLFTPFERYPLRDLLGLGKDLPAMQVFMVFKRLRLHELPREADTRSASEGRRHHQPLHRGRVAEERERLREWLRAQEDRANNNNERARFINRQQDRTRASAAQSPSMQSIHLVRIRGDKPAAVAMPPAEVQEWPAVAVNAQDPLPPAFFANVRTREDDEIHFVKDGYRRTSLRVWLLQQRKVSEHTLRSFLRQMLLAIHALEQSGALHADISTTTILVLERAKSKHSTASFDGDQLSQERHKQQQRVAEMPVFQLHCSHNTWYEGNLELPTGNNNNNNAMRQSLLRGAPAAAAQHQRRERHNQRFDEELLRLRRRDAERLELLAELDNDDEDDFDEHPEFAHLAFQQRPQPPCMLNSLLRCAISLWSRGRFPDTHQNNHMALLSVLVTLHAHIPAGLRSFAEYTKFLMLSGTPSAARLLSHAFVADPSITQPSPIPIRPIQPQDVLDYQASILAWYGNAQAVAARSARRGSTDVASQTDTHSLSSPELMPRTQMGPAYFLHALEEANLPQERFVSIVAPQIKSSSWIRKVAETQRHTLQRLDLSNVMLPTSVLLKELSNLPRITHLRLPVNIERHDDLEHFLAALSCTNLLPNLRAMDESVKLAMDRIEKTYLDQLGMVEFLLDR